MEFEKFSPQEMQGWGADTASPDLESQTNTTEPSNKPNDSFETNNHINNDAVDTSSEATPNSEKEVEKNKPTSFEEWANDMRERHQEMSLTIEAERALNQMPQLYHGLYVDAQKCVIELRNNGASNELISQAEGICKQIDKEQIKLSFSYLFDMFKAGLRAPQSQEDFVIHEAQRRADITKRINNARKACIQISNRINRLKDHANGSSKKIVESAAIAMDMRISSSFHTEPTHKPTEGLIDEERTDGPLDDNDDVLNYAQEKHEESSVDTEATTISAQEESEKEVTNEKETSSDVDDQSNWTRETINDSYMRVGLLESMVNEIPVVCQELSTHHNAILDRLRQDGASEKTISGLESIGRMINQLSANIDIDKLTADMKQLLETPIPDIQEVDYDHLASLSQEDSLRYLEDIQANNAKIVRTITGQQNSLLRQTEDTLRELTNIAQNIHIARGYAEDTSRAVIDSYAQIFDSILSDGFQVRRIDIQPGHTYSNDIANHAQVVGVRETDDVSLDNCIASVSGASYSFNPELGLNNDPFGDSLGDATVEVYKYQAR